MKNKRSCLVCRRLGNSLFCSGKNKQIADTTLEAKNCNLFITNDNKVYCDCGNELDVSFSCCVVCEQCGRKICGG